jgi:hypothetical protein
MAKRAAVSAAPCPAIAECGVGAVAAVWVGLKASKQEDKMNGHAHGGGGGSLSRVRVQIALALCAASAGCAGP